jgi:hypothetical protein
LVKACPEAWLGKTGLSAETSFSLSLVLETDHFSQAFDPFV